MHCKEMNSVENSFCNLLKVYNHWQMLGTKSGVGNTTRSEGPLVETILRRGRHLRIDEVAALWLQVKAMFKKPKRATAAAGMKKCSSC